MKFPNCPHCQPATPDGTRRLCLRLAAAIVALLFPLATGCASPGPPRPPSLRLPEVVANLTAQRVGDDVELHWTTPAKTTDQLGITGPITAEICREAHPATSPGKPENPPPSACIATKRLSVSPGPSQTTDALPANLTVDSLTLLAYRVQIFNDTGHSAGLSPRAFTAAGAAPPQVRMRATAIKSGIQLEWPQSAPPFPVELDRLHIPEPPPKTAAQNTKPKPAASQPFDIAPTAPAEVHLRADNQATDAGGTIDRTAQKTQTYAYTAQRARKVVLDGHTIELRSLPSPTVTVAMLDTFAPARPTGLAAIPGGTNAADASSTAGKSIDLSWQPNTETDVAGYIVYRQEASPNGTPSGPATRLTPTPIVGPGFSDKTAIPGHHYAYYVTAVDTTGNESVPSAAVTETLTEQ